MKTFHLTFLALAGAALAQHTIPLAGKWRFATDPNKEGPDKRFFQRQLAGSILLPGSTDEAKIGPNTKPPTLDGLYRLYEYEGPAWYQRDVEIPAAWRGKHLSLFIERAHWETRAWLDDRYAGSADSLVAPHIHDLGTNVTPGKHRLTICADNTPKFDLGPFVSVTYEGTQTNWNGLIGKLELRAEDPVALADVEVYSDVERRLVNVRAIISNTTGKPVRGTLRLACRQTVREVPFTARGDRSAVTGELPMGENVRLWDEFSPALYDLTVSLAAEDGSASQTHVTFGMRKFASEGTQFTMNGRRLFLRGTLECGIFPRTGYPPTDVLAWRRIYQILKSYGLNFIRFHSWCPPEAAFSAADLEGIMVQAEGPQANVNAGVNRGRDAFIEQEFLRMVRTYGNHPSFCLMTLGNEYSGPEPILSRWIDRLIKADPRHLYSTPSAGGMTPNRQFTEGMPRGIHGPGTDADFDKQIAEQDRPLIGHEIGQWTFYPNFDEMEKYTGVLAPRNFELVRQDLARKHMLDLAPLFFKASGQHAVLLYKEEIEVLLRTRGHAGFSLLDMHDYPGQGTALIGPLDPFWDSKGFVTPQAHRQYCGPTVPLLRMKKRTFTADETFTAEAEIAHFGPNDMAGATPHWVMRGPGGREIASGALAARRVPTGKLSPLGAIQTPLAGAPAPCKLTVTVSLEGTEFANSWEIWVYPSGAPPPAPAQVLVSRNWDDTAKTALAQGRKVVLFPDAAAIPQSLRGKFLPVFWSPLWFPDQQPNTMGILCDPKHPLFSQFPTEFHSNWQWYDLIQNSRSLILDETRGEFRLIVQVIDNFSRNHKLGTVFEARVGEGRLLVCSMDLPGLAGRQPAANQLLRSLYAYVDSPAFDPAQQLPLSLLDKILTRAGGSPMQRLGAHIVRVDSQMPYNEAESILDGNPLTTWHTAGRGAQFPHEVVIGFPNPLRIAGLVCLPGQYRWSGWVNVIQAYEVQVSDDDKTWRTAASGEFERRGGPQRIDFTQPQTARYLKFIARSGVGGRRDAALADLLVVLAGRP